MIDRLRSERFFQRCVDALRASVLCGLGWIASPAHADEPAAHTPAFKLSLGNYFFDDRGDRYSGQDLNLRYRRDDASVWVGYYDDPQFGSEQRAGFDTALTLWQPMSLSLLPSMLVANHGFVGGSLALQVGSTWFAQFGIGRTNLHPYVDLSFDPNDALTAAVGYRAEDGRSFALSTVHDDRLHTGQRNTHVNLQWPLSADQRLTLDVSHKSGEGDGGHVSAWGGVVTYDFPRWFLRAAYDAHQNFGSADVTRISAGLRF